MMRNYLQNLKNDLDFFSDEQATITVNRKDLEQLVKKHEKLLEKEAKKQRSFEFERE